MSNIPAVNQGQIQEQETEFKAAVSEYTARRMGSNINFGLTYFVPVYEWKMNGPTGSFSGQLGVDGLFHCNSNCEIVKTVIYCNQQGNAGTNNIDIKWSAAWNGSTFGTWTSIYSTTPKITSTAPAYATCATGDTVTGCTAAIMTTTPFQLSVGDRLRLDCLSTQSGSPRNQGLILYFRAR